MSSEVVSRFQARLSRVAKLSSYHCVIYYVYDTQAFPDWLLNSINQTGDGANIILKLFSAEWEDQREELHWRYEAFGSIPLPTRTVVITLLDDIQMYDIIIGFVINSHFLCTFKIPNGAQFIPDNF